MIVLPDGLVMQHRKRIIEFAVLQRIPVISGWSEFAKSGGTMTYEPGGQIELSSSPCRTASALLAELRGTVLPLRAAAAADGIDLLAVGIDPFNPEEHCPLLLRLKRYERMAEYLATRGPAGAMMMRQTAAFQITLDLDDEPLLRWRVLNAAAPYVTAIFANKNWSTAVTGTTKTPPITKPVSVSNGVQWLWPRACN